MSEVFSIVERVDKDIPPLLDRSEKDIAI